MSGHNKWSKIKRKKEISDSQKSKVFSKLVKFIQTESRKANGDVNTPGLRSAIEKAKKENMPGDNIERAVKKGGGGDGFNLESIIYEAYGPGGVAVMIETLTDNKNRTFSEIKHILSKNNSSIARINAVKWAFEKKDDGWIPKVPAKISADETEKLEKLIEELEENEDIQNVYTNSKKQ